MDEPIYDNSSLASSLFLRQGDGIEIMQVTDTNQDDLCQIDSIQTRTMLFDQGHDGHLMKLCPSNLSDFNVAEENDTFQHCLQSSFPQIHQLDGASCTSQPHQLLQGTRCLHRTACEPSKNTNCFSVLASCNGDAHSFKIASSVHVDGTVQQQNKGLSEESMKIRFETVRSPHLGESFGQKHNIQESFISNHSEKGSICFEDCLPLPSNLLDNLRCISTEHSQLVSLGTVRAESAISLYQTHNCSEDGNYDRHYNMERVQYVYDSKDPYTEANQLNDKHSERASSENIALGQRLETLSAADVNYGFEVTELQDNSGNAVYGSHEQLQPTPINYPCFTTDLVDRSFHKNYDEAFGSSEHSKLCSMNAILKDSRDVRDGRMGYAEALDGSVDKIFECLGSECHEKSCTSDGLREISNTISDELTEGIGFMFNSVNRASKSLFCINNDGKTLNGITTKKDGERAIHESSDKQPHIKHCPEANQKAYTVSVEAFEQSECFNSDAYLCTEGSESLDRRCMQQHPDCFSGGSVKASLKSVGSFRFCPEDLIIQEPSQAFILETCTSGDDHNNTSSSQFNNLLNNMCYLDGNKDFRVLKCADNNAEVESTDREEAVPNKSVAYQTVHIPEVDADGGYETQVEGLWDEIGNGTHAECGPVPSSRVVSSKNISPSSVLFTNGTPSHEWTLCRAGLIHDASFKPLNCTEAQISSCIDIDSHQVDREATCKTDDSRVLFSEDIGYTKSFSKSLSMEPPGEASKPECLRGFQEVAKTPCEKELASMTSPDSSSFNRPLGGEEGASLPIKHVDLLAVEDTLHPSVELDMFCYKGKSNTSVHPLTPAYHHSEEATFNPSKAIDELPEGKERAADQRHFFRSNEKMKRYDEENKLKSVVCPVSPLKSDSQGVVNTMFEPNLDKLEFSTNQSDTPPDNMGIDAHDEIGVHSQKQILKGTLDQHQEAGEQNDLEGSFFDYSNKNLYAGSTRVEKAEVPLKIKKDPIDQKFSYKKQNIPGRMEESPAASDLMKRKAIEEPQERNGKTGLRKKLANHGTCSEFKFERKLGNNTLMSFRDQLVPESQTQPWGKKAINVGKRLCNQKRNRLEQSKSDMKSTDRKDSAIKDRMDLKLLSREMAQKTLLEAGFKIDYRPRRNRDYQDAVYVAPDGRAYWSLPKAWKVLQKIEAESSRQNHGLDRPQGSPFVAYIHGKSETSPPKVRERRKCFIKADKNYPKTVTPEFGDGEQFHPILSKYNGCSSSNSKMDHNVARVVDTVNTDLIDSKRGSNAPPRKKRKRLISCTNSVTLLEPQTVSVKEKKGTKKKVNNISFLGMSKYKNLDGIVSANKLSASEKRVLNVRGCIKKPGSSSLLKASETDARKMKSERMEREVNSLLSKCDNSSTLKVSISKVSRFRKGSSKKVNSARISEYKLFDKRYLERRWTKANTSEQEILDNRGWSKKLNTVVTLGRLERKTLNGRGLTRKLDTVNMSEKAEPKVLDSICLIRNSEILSTLGVSQPKVVRSIGSMRKALNSRDSPKKPQRDAFASPLLQDKKPGNKRTSGQSEIEGKSVVSKLKTKKGQEKQRTVLHLVGKKRPKLQIGLSTPLEHKVKKKSHEKKIAYLNPASNKYEKPKSQTGLRLEVRHSSSSGNEEPACHTARTVFGWMLDRGAVLDGEKIFLMDQVNHEVVKEGVITREGILCLCCERVFTVQRFQSHAGNQSGDWHLWLISTSGKRLLDCQLNAWEAEIHLRKVHNYIGVSDGDTNDDSCLLCGDGGDLLCCDGCPSTFHASCLELDNVPDGDWYCPKCCCGICGGFQHAKENEEEDSALVLCNQCDRRYHIVCLHACCSFVGHEVFCQPSCEQMFQSLRSTIGISHPLHGGFSWTLLRCMEEDNLSEEERVMHIDCHSKLAVALLVIKECFNPMVDPRTNIDMITHAMYNRRSDFDRLDYPGFYTAILEREGEIISVASIRLHGTRLAEMPLIGTREKYRRQGMCRLLVGVIEKLLNSLSVSLFLLPAIPELFDTWTKAFGFKPLDASLKSALKDICMMVFPGTELLQKELPGKTAKSLLKKTAKIGIQDNSLLGNSEVFQIFHSKNRQ